MTERLKSKEEELKNIKTNSLQIQTMNNTYNEEISRLTSELIQFSNTLENQKLFYEQELVDKDVLQKKIKQQEEELASYQEKLNRAENETQMCMAHATQIQADYEKCNAELNTLKIVKKTYKEQVDALQYEMNLQKEQMKSLMDVDKAYREYETLLETAMKAMFLYDMMKGTIENKYEAFKKISEEKPTERLYNYMIRYYCFYMTDDDFNDDDEMDITKERERVDEGCRRYNMYERAKFSDLLEVLKLYVMSIQTSKTVDINNTFLVQRIYRDFLTTQKLPSNVLFATTRQQTTEESRKSLLGKVNRIIRTDNERIRAILKKRPTIQESGGDTEAVEEHDRYFYGFLDALFNPEPSTAYDRIDRVSTTLPDWQVSFQSLQKKLYSALKLPDGTDTEILINLAFWILDTYFVGPVDFDGIPKHEYVQRTDGLRLYLAPIKS